MLAHTVILRCGRRTLSRWIQRHPKTTSVSPSPQEGLQEERWHYVPPELQAVITEGRPLSQTDWEQLKSVSVGYKNITERNFPGFVMRVCAAQSKFAVGKSLLNTLEKWNTPPGIGTLSKFMRLCGTSLEDCGEDVILATYDKIKRMTDVFDEGTLEDMIIALCETSQWTESIKLLKVMENQNLASGRPNLLSHIAIAAFKRGNHNLGWEMVVKIHELGLEHRPSETVFDTWLDLCNEHVRLGDESSQDQACNMFWRMMHYIRDYQYYPSVTLVQRITDCFNAINKISTSAVLTTISRGSRVCQNCGEVLPAYKFDENEFLSLRSAFMEKVITGNDVFMKTSPFELRQFREMVTMAAPFDLVIDGLNILYRISNSHKKSSGLNQLASIVQFYAEDLKKKVLVMGRHHMRRKDSAALKYIKKRSLLFTTESLSQDDPFLIYAALSSGPECFILSCDMLRDHTARIHDHSLKRLFLKWLHCRRMEFHGLNSSGKPIIQAPILHAVQLHEHQHGYHLPYNDGSVKSFLSVPETWICTHVPSKSSLLYKK
ncbi:unnamed protein product [Darwinula stevensoni]|uniref:Mitochondrial ribonuclease P catalytic subunit n=1 Tax=Darwinula stevensoni TaxID=69355 RepID=A0A7R8XD32_9CRUS|nr:unnamed protein product [Darwinula stevensoni]CAG0888237.1 unnamed protein product [Darwinula stevensoni]